MKVTLGSLVALALAVTPTSAHAQSAAQSAVLFKEAQALMAKGRYAEACDAFDASQKLDPTVSTMLNQANCREQNGQLATAWGLFLVAERETRTAADDQARQLHKVASEHAAKLEPRLSTLTVRVPDEVKIGGLEVLRGTEVVEPALWNKAVPLDGGTYTIVARAPGNAQWTTTISIAGERDARSIDVPRLAAAALHPPEVTPPPPVVVVAPRAVIEPPPSIALRPEPRTTRLPLYLGAAAVVAVGGGLAFELTARSTYDGISRSRWETANHERYTAEALATAGAVTAGVAIYLYVRGRRGEHGVTVAPAVTGDRVGVQLMGGL